MVLDPHRWLELRRFRGLLESGALSLSEIARETGLDRKTVRKYLSSPGPTTPPRRAPNGRPRARVIDEFAPLVVPINGPSYRLKNRLQAIERETDVA
ncbi:hypothetical protein QF035_010864 [Streptomyces umbrinus]|uniref:HTH IS21-type domain-containing protein n=1 Tax=Streptomyces umbrinus TaxID=67370 RepID=A0ABU0TCB3_9ACTN|nr:hypothetical protein [Streptomyces umbrinus]